MPYILEHSKDSYTIVAKGTSLKDAFIEGARGVFSISYDIERLTGGDSVEIIAQGPSPEVLFQSWIQELIDRAMVNEVAMAEFDVHAIQHVNETDWLLTGTAWMAGLQMAKSHATGVRVKSIKRGSATCNESKEGAVCSITVIATA